MTINKITGNPERQVGEFLNPTGMFLWSSDIVQIGHDEQRFKVGDKVQFYQERHLRGVISSIVQGEGVISEVVTPTVYKIDGDETRSNWNVKFIRGV